MHAIVLALLLAAPATHAAPAQPAQVPAPWDLLWSIDPPDGTPHKPRPPASKALRALGRSLYADRCAICHGAQGDGQAPLGVRLNPRATAFTSGVYKLRSTPPGALPSDLDLFRTLTRGMHGTAMQPWRRLGERERWALVDHLKSLSPRFAAEPPAPTMKVPVAPRELPDLQDRGERLYLRHACGACHGSIGDGNGRAVLGWRNTPNRDALPRDFSRGRFIRGTEMEDIYLTLKLGVEGTPMPAYTTLSDEELWALAAYVRVLVRERPIDELPPAGTQARDEHAPGAALP